MEVAMTTSDYWLPLADWPTIRIVDHKRKTVCECVRLRLYDAQGNWNGEEKWGVEHKPERRKAKQRLFEYLPKRDHVRVEHSVHDRPNPLKYLPAEDRHVLELPGLTLRWEKVTPVLDKLADHNVTTLTVDELRGCIR
jgi:hypothetical protein